MSEPKWTPAQRAAIEDRGGALLVSAAAGSGKTAVLTERAVRLITDPDHPVDADKMLIVTFTNAAAAELRARIGQALLRLSQQQPHNTSLRRQRMLLQRAPICTIDAFCLDLLHKHFQALDIPPDFAPADPGSVEVLRASALAETLENAYRDPDFCAFADLYGKGRTDQAAGNTILHVYDFLRALPDYDRRLDEYLAPWQRENGFAFTCWHDLLLAEAARCAKAARELLTAALADCKEDFVLAQAQAEEKGKTAASKAKAVAGVNDKFAEPLSRLESAAALLGELLLSPRTVGEGFLPDYVRQEQSNLIDRIRAQVNDKRRYASARLCQLMCREEAFGVDKLGDEAHAAAITPEGLWSRYQQLLRTAEIEVYYCGSAQPERAARALTAALSGLPRDGERLDPECEVRLHAGPEPQLVEEHMDVSQGKLALGFRTGGLTCWEEEYPALVMCNAIFGGTPLSKLFLNVREKLSLCYYASSMLEKMKGLVLVSSGIEFDKYQQARDEILAQLEAIRRGEIEDWELEGARSTMRSALISLSDSQGAMENYCLGQAATGQSEDPETMQRLLDQVTPERIRAAAQSVTLDTVYFLHGKEEA